MSKMLKCNESASTERTGRNALRHVLSVGRKETGETSVPDVYREELAWNGNSIKTKTLCNTHEKASQIELLGL